MMKRLLTMLLALMMVFAMAACTPGETNETSAAATTTEAPVIVPESALEILENTWNAYSEDEKFFAAGGDMNSYVDGAPGNYNVEDTDGMTYTLLVPAEQITNIDDAASLTHALNLNNFTCGVFHIAAGADADAFATAMRDAVQGKQWVCGFPDKVIVSVIADEYVLCAFGISEMMDTFEARFTGAYPDAVVSYNETVGG